MIKRTESEMEGHRGVQVLFSCKDSMDSVALVVSEGRWVESDVWLVLRSCHTSCSEPDSSMASNSGNMGSHSVGILARNGGVGGMNRA